MKKFFLFEIFLFFILFKLYKFDEREEEGVQKIFHLEKIVFTIFKNIVNDKNNNLTNSCRQNLKNAYKEENEEEIQNLYEGSSKGFTELSSFYNCEELNDKKNTDNKRYNFYTIYPNLGHVQIIALNEFINESTRLNHSWIFGFCLFDEVCNEDEIKDIFIAVNQKFQSYNMTIFDEYYNNKSHFKVIDNYKKHKDLTDLKSFENIFRLLPAVLIVIQIIFLILKIIPVKIFGCCIKLKYKNEFKNNPKTIGKLLNTGVFDKIINTKIKEYFSITEDFYDLIYKKKDNELFQEEDLTYIKGIRGIGIFSFIVGTIYIYCFNYPINITNNSEKKDFMKSERTIFFNICFRISPALLLSTSGYSLSYKFLNFLDKKLVNIIPEKEEFKFNLKEDKEILQENNNILENQKQENNPPSNEGSSSKQNSTKIKTMSILNSQTNNELFTNKSKLEKIEGKKSLNNDKSNYSYYENTLGIKFYENDISKIALNNIFKNQRVNDVIALSKISTDKIPLSTFFNFFFRQIHKLFLLIIAMQFFLDFCPVVFHHSPLMNYLFTEVLDKLKKSIGYFLYYENIRELFVDHGSYDKYHQKNLSFLSVFSIIICEVNFYVIGTLLIFICYKKKKRLDRIIYGLIIIFIIIKAVYNNKKEHCNPGMFYFNSVYQRFFFNPVSNFNYYLIGILFGMVNYVIQNGITNNEAFIDERPMINLPILLSEVCDYNKYKNIIHFICCIIFLFIFLFIFPIMFKYKFETYIVENSPSTLFKIISSMDIEFFLYLFHFFIMSCYISGRNIIFNFFNSNIWLQTSKLYFCLIIFTPIVCYYIIYSAEMELNIRVGIILVYVAICTINLYTISLCYYIILELPYKKYIKLYFNISFKIDKSQDDEDEDDEESYPLHESIATEMVDTFNGEEKNKEKEYEADNESD